MNNFLNENDRIHIHEHIHVYNILVNIIIGSYIIEELKLFFLSQHSCSKNVEYQILLIDSYMN